MTHASLKLFLVGTGWMNQTISAIRALPLERPFESSVEAQDAVRSFRKELLATGLVSPEKGLVATTHSFGDFQDITDVRMDYVVESQSTGQGIFGTTTTFTTAQSSALDFDNPDSEFALHYEED